MCQGLPSAPAGLPSVQVHACLVFLLQLFIKKKTESRKFQTRVCVLRFSFDSFFQAVRLWLEGLPSAPVQAGFIFYQFFLKIHFFWWWNKPDAFFFSNVCTCCLSFSSTHSFQVGRLWLVVLPSESEVHFFFVFFVFFCFSSVFFSLLLLLPFLTFQNEHWLCFQVLRSLLAHRSVLEVFFLLLLPRLFFVCFRWRCCFFCLLLCKTGPPVASGPPKGLGGIQTTFCLPVTNLTSICSRYDEKEESCDVSHHKKKSEHGFKKTR